MTLRRPGVAWGALAVLLGALSIAVAFVPTSIRLDWEPVLAPTQPWRAWTAALVHLSHWHLIANLAGALVVGGLGVTGRLPARAALAWACAWPLTQALLLMRPALAHYAGLSGVLHAGVAIAAWHLMRHGRAREPWIGALIAVGLGLKLAFEAPFGPVLTHPGDWDIPIAPFAHFTGTLAGAVCALVFDLKPSRPAR